MSKNKNRNINNSQENWVQNTWRPAMGWMYFAVCIFDFIIFPIFWSVLQSLQDGNISSQWSPLTILGGGLFHIAMGAVLGISVWTRSREKIDGVSGDTEETPTNQRSEREE